MDRSSAELAPLAHLLRKSETESDRRSTGTRFVSASARRRARGIRRGEAPPSGTVGREGGNEVCRRAARDQRAECQAIVDRQPGAVAVVEAIVGEAEVD